MGQPPFRKGVDILGKTKIFGAICRLFRPGVIVAPDPGSATVPDAPPAVLGTPGSSAVFVSWSAPANNGGSPITTYTVYRYDAGSLTPAATYSSVPTSFNVTGLSSAVSYQFAVSATNVIGEGPQSSKSASVSPAGAPSPVASVTLSSTGANQLTATWPAATGSGAPVLDYLVELLTGTTVVTTQTTTSPLTATFASLTPDTLYAARVSARNIVGYGSATTSNTVEANWEPVTLRPYGGWTGGTRAGSDPGSADSLTLTREAATSINYDGLMVHHDVVAGTTNFVEELWDDRVEDRLLEGDEWVFYLPFQIPTITTSGASTIWRLSPGGANVGLSRLSLAVNSATVDLKGPSSTLSSKAWGGTAGSFQTDFTHMTYWWVRVKVSSNASVGWVEWGRTTPVSGATVPSNGSTGIQHNVAPTTNSILGRTSVALLQSGDTYLQVHAGQINTASPTVSRRIAHSNVTGWRRNRTGEWSASGWQRIRFDPDFDTRRTGYQNYPNSTNNQSYSLITASGTYSGDRIRYVTQSGRFAARFLVRPNDLASSGQRSELSMIRRPVYLTTAASYEPNAPLRMFTEGDKIIIRGADYFPDSTNFPLTTSGQWATISQEHQLSESGGSPPHERGFSLPTTYQHRTSQTVDEANNNTSLTVLFGNPPTRLVWNDFVYTVLVSDNGLGSTAKGYVQMMKDGSEVIAKTHRRTLYLPPSPQVTLSTGELLGTDTPEYDYHSEGLYEQRTANGGYNVDRVLYHDINSSITVYRDPAKTRLVDQPSLG